MPATPHLGASSVGSGVVLAEAVSLDGGVLFLVLLVLVVVAALALAVTAGGCALAFRAGRGSHPATAWLGALVVGQALLVAAVGVLAVVGVVAYALAFLVGAATRPPVPSGQRDDEGR